MKPYESYKETTYEWLPSIPKHWNWLYLSQVSSEQQIKNKDETETNVLSLSYGNIIRKKNIDFGLVPKDYVNYQIVDKGNIILRLTDLQNDHKSLRTGLVKERGIITSAYTCLKPKENAEYLQYLLHSFDTQKVFYGMGGGVRQSIGFSDIRSMRLPVPPINEQDQIVRFLDWKLSKINKLIKAKKKQIALLDEQKQAIINKAVTKGLDDNVPMIDSGIEWIGEIPTNANIAKLKNCIIKLGDIDHRMPESVDDGVPYISPINFYGENEIDFANAKKISEKDFMDLSRKIAPAKSDIIFSRYATLGAIRYVETNIPFLVSYSCVTIKPNVNIVSPKFLYYFLKSNIIEEDLRSHSVSTTQANIGTDSLRNFYVVLLSREKQDYVVAYLDSICKCSKMAIDNLKKELELLTEYKTSLISSVVTGKVDVRDVVIPNFETEDESWEDNTDDIGELEE